MANNPMKNFPMKRCYRVLYKIVCIHCRNHATKTTCRTHCKFALGACLKFYINCLVSGLEPIFKIYWSCLPLSKHYADKENAVCVVLASMQTGLLDNYRKII